MPAAGKVLLGALRIWEHGHSSGVSLRVRNLEKRNASGWRCVNRESVIRLKRANSGTPGATEVLSQHRPALLLVTDCCARSHFLNLLAAHGYVVRPLGTSDGHRADEFLLIHHGRVEVGCNLGLLKPILNALFFGSLDTSCFHLASDSGSPIVSYRRRRSSGWGDIQRGSDWHFKTCYASSF